MAEGSRSRTSPWLAFVAGALVIVIAVGAYILWRGGPAVTAQDVGVDIDVPATPGLPPIAPSPDPAPIPLPTPSPQP